MVNFFEQSWVSGWCERTRSHPFGEGFVVDFLGAKVEDSDEELLRTLLVIWMEGWCCARLAYFGVRLVSPSHRHDDG